MSSDIGPTHNSPALTQLGRLDRLEHKPHRLILELDRALLHLWHLLILPGSLRA